MTYWKRLVAALFALIGVFVITFDSTAVAATSAPTIAPEEALKLRTQITDLQDRLEAFEDSFDGTNWADIQQQFPAFVKDARSSLDDLTAKVVTPTVKSKYDAIAEKFTGYFTKLDEANDGYKSAKEDYDTATKTYQDTVKSTYDKIVASLDGLLKLIPKAE